MKFTYDSYVAMLKSLQKCGYAFSLYNNWQNSSRCVILRHDVDNDLQKALMLASIEHSFGVQSTYFVLLTSDFYNVLSTKNMQIIKKIRDYGHVIGLHFDEGCYPTVEDPHEVVFAINKEAEILAQVIGSKVSVVSMHRPSQRILDADIVIPGIINSYSQLFFKSFKYVSDSRRCWREPIDEIISSRKYDRLHILTHAIWYNDDELNLHDSVCSFVNCGNRERYYAEKGNIKDLQSIMSESEIR